MQTPGPPQIMFMVTETKRHTKKDYTAECIKIAREIIPGLITEALNNEYYLHYPTELLSRVIMPAVYQEYIKQFKKIQFCTIHGPTWDNADRPVYNYIIIYTDFKIKWVPLIREYYKTQKHLKGIECPY